MFKKTFVLTIVIVSILSFYCFAQDQHVNIDRKTSIEVGGWLPSLNGSVRSGSANRVNFIDGLGLSHSNGGPVFGFRYNITEDSNIQFSYFSLESNSSHVVVNPFTWKLRTFNANNTVDSTLKMKILDAIYEKNWYKNDESELNFALGVKYAYFGLALNNVTQNASIGQSFRGIIPVIGLSGRSKMIDQWEGTAKVNFMAANSQGVSGRFIDLAGGVRWNFYTNWSADFQYRWVNFFGRGDSTLDEVDINYGGPMVLIRAEY